MHRSSSASRVSSEDPLLTNSITSQSKVTKLILDVEQLPTLNPLSHAAHKDRLRLRSAGNAIHAIPLLLILRALILWFFSNSG